MTRPRSVALSLGLLCGLLAGADLALAQATDEINSALQFNFSNPGARSLGLAGAFTACADDATAAYANPAGLLQLHRPEVALDFRGWRSSNQFLDRGTQVSLDSLAGLEFGATDDRSEGLSFVSAIYPHRGGRWVFAVFRHEAVHFTTRVQSAGALVRSSSGGLPLARPLEGLYQLDIESFGTTAAVRVGDRLSIGVTLSLARFALDSRTERLDKLRADVVPGEDPGFFAVDPQLCCVFADRDDVIRFETQKSDPEHDDDLTGTLGLLWHSRRKVEGASLVSIGAFYRAGPELGFLADSFVRQRGDLRPDGRREISYASTLGDPDDPEVCHRPGRPGCPGTFKVPDVYGAGISFRPSLFWVVAFDVNRIEYSDLTDELLDVIGSDSALVDGTRGRPADFAVDDGWELRLGVEKAWFPERRAVDLFLRAGVWLDPDHEIRYTGTRSDLQALWLPGEDETHLALGFGLRRRRLQVDAAIDVSERLDTVSISAVYYFRDH